MPPRLAAVVLPVGFLGSRGRRGGRDFVRRVATRRGDAGRDRRPARGVDARGALPGPARRDRHRRRLARLRLLHGRDRALRLGGRRDRRPRGADHAHARAPAADPRLLQRVDARNRRDGGRIGDRATPRRRRHAGLRASARRSAHALRGQPAADQPRRQRQLAEADRAGRPHQHHHLGDAVCADGLGGIDARRSSGSGRRSSRARSSGRCSRSRSTSARRSGSCGQCGSR